MLCETCKNIFLGFLDSNGLPLRVIDQSFKRHHYSVEDLHEAAAANCQICVQLFLNLQRHYWTIFTPDSTFSASEKEQTMIKEMMANQESYLRNLNISASRDKYLLTYKVRNSIGLRVDGSERDLSFLTWGYHLYTSRDPTEDVFESYFQHFVTLPSERKFTFLAIRSPLTQSPVAQEYTLTERFVSADRSDRIWRLNLSKSWLQDCLSKHSECRHETPGWHPTRLLKITGSGNSTIRLILTKSEPPAEHSKPYLTLSHCWGKARFLTLTAHTLPQLLQGADISKLPKTFQEAVNTTLFFGFEYLWICSLCILQDSIEDWKVESAHMGDVYSNGVCNLAATGSADANGGLWMGPQQFNLESLVDDSSPGVDSPPKWHTHPARLQDAILLLDGPLLKRGWVVQERILAPRTLHFGIGQLFWECKQFQACETYPGGLPSTMYADKVSFLPLVILQEGFGSASENFPLSLQDITSCWATIVNEYSKCDLTKPEEKLVAISGLARQSKNGTHNSTSWPAW
jgi:hypothetical protein